MEHIANAFAPSRDQEFPELFKTLNMIASHDVSHPAASERVNFAVPKV
jgi:hypothetical protein